MLKFADFFREFQHHAGVREGFIMRMTCERNA